MSTRDDASLTGRERAALASLEAMATADDPELAARLRGARFRLRLLAWRPAVPAWMRNRWWGAPMTVVGLFLVVLGLSTGFGVGFMGACLAGAGIWLIVQAVGARWVEWDNRPGQSGPPPAG